MGLRLDVDQLKERDRSAPPTVASFSRFRSEKGKSRGFRGATLVSSSQRTQLFENLALDERKPTLDTASRTSLNH
ncbi:MAG: hypothetical protein SW833_00995 [Cyanobacteriota bacterium]|nr:hypothetical protein [Cyanobacteriota bacterium]